MPLDKMQILDEFSSACGGNKWLFIQRRFGEATAQLTAQTNVDNYSALFEWHLDDQLIIPVIWPSENKFFFPKPSKPQHLTRGW